MMQVMDAAYFDGMTGAQIAEQFSEQARQLDEARATIRAMAKGYAGLEDDLASERRGRAYREQEQ